jgi:hypothetical protein
MFEVVPFKSSLTQQHLEWPPSRMTLGRDRRLDGFTIGDPDQPGRALLMSTPEPGPKAASQTSAFGFSAYK